jgi:tRNA-Thr(GGU) m(6)t(6)A37 methyltransferase TsaA
MTEQVTYTPIGTVSTPFETPDAVPKRGSESSEAEGTVDIDPAYAEGLAGLDGFSHVVLVTHLHQVEAHTLRCDPPFAEGVEPGIFATSGPRRPNPIGLTVVRLAAVDGTTLRVRGIDVVDGTPLLDLKPHAPKQVTYEDFSGGWLEAHTDQDFAALRE